MTIFRSLITISLFIAFLLLWYWAWRTERREDFAAAARLPLEDEIAMDTAMNGESKHSS